MSGASGGAPLTFDRMSSYRPVGTDSGVLALDRWLFGSAPPQGALNKAFCSLAGRVAGGDDPEGILFMDRVGVVVCVVDGAGDLRLHAWLFSALPRGCPTRGLELLFARRR
jgi:hypothetical protein